MKKLIWVLCQEDEKWNKEFYEWPKGIPTLDHDEIKEYIYRK
jgi:hypothetical protein